MKHTILLVIMSLALAFPGLQDVTAQGWFIVFEEKFAPGNRAHFMKAQKEAIDMWKIYNPDVPVFAWQNDDNTLNRVIPIYSFASIDTLHRKMKQVSKSIRATGYNADQNSGQQITVSGSVMEWAPDLSHRQGPEFSENPNKPYTEWMFAYLLSGHEQEAEEAYKKFRDYYTDNRLDYPWDTFRVLLGDDTPLIISMFRAESPAALQAKGKRIWKKHGSELEKLWQDVVRHTWKMETRTGWFNQSLSNIPMIEPDGLVKSE